MKNLLLIFLIITLSGKIQNLTTKESYIEFTRISPVSSTNPRPLIISKNNLGYKLSKEEEKDYEKLRHYIPNKSDYIKIQYEFMITDSITMAKLSNYLLAQRYKYLTTSNNLHGYGVILNYHAYFVTDQNARKFFDNLFLFIKQNKLDSNIISKIPFK